jgi:MFS family permease
MPDRQSAPPSQRTQVLLLGVLGAIQVADPLVATLTLVKASDELNLTASLQSLAAGASTFALAATVIPGGVLADRLGRRTVLAFSVLLAALGQLTSAFGPSPSVFLLGRIITGVALGTTFAAAYGMLKNVTSEADRGPALAMFSVANTVVPLVILVSAGPVAAVNWRWAYLILPVVSVLVFPLTLRLLPAVPRRGSGRVDYLGMILVAAGVAGLLLGISSAGSGVQSPSFWLPILVGVAALAGFGYHGSTAPNPVFPPRILAHPAFLAAVLLGIVFNFASGGSSQMSANFWQYVVHLPTAVIGIASAPIAVVSVVAAIIAGRLVKAGRSAGVIALIGCALTVLGLVSLGFMTPTSTYLAFVPMMVLSGLGVASVALVQGNLFLSLAPARFFGPVTSSKTAVGQFGYSLGLSGTTVLVSLFTLNGVERASGGAISGEGSWDSITSFLATGATTDPTLARIGQPAVSAIYAQAFSWTALISAALVAALAVLIAWSLRRPAAKTPVEEFLGLSDRPLEPATEEHR